MQQVNNNPRRRDQCPAVSQKDRSLKLMKENQQALIDFFNSRPALSQSAVAREAGIDRQLLYYVLRWQRNLTSATWDKLRPVLEKYGM